MRPKSMLKLINLKLQKLLRKQRG